MSDRLFHVLQTVQQKYLHDPSLNDEASLRDRVRELERGQERIAGEEWDRLFEDRRPGTLHGVEAVQNMLALYAAAEDQVIEREIVARLPARAVHEHRHKWAYLVSEITPPIDPELIYTGAGSAKTWLERAAAAGMETERVNNPWDYHGIDPIEDLALPPDVSWTDADKKAAMESWIDAFGLEPGHWIELDWPPEANLWSLGHLYRTEFEPCEAHAEAYDDVDGDESYFEDCADCSQVEVIVEEMAQWTWSTSVNLMKLYFSSEGEELDRRVYRDGSFEICTMEQDPRDIVIGPPGRGSRW
ncbi:hypothetical protein ACFZC5_34090 [Nocardia gamkensis]|uniref:hypothetical protein n=1 Tax=Nocardia gamkensis TaxID=352869 RepID=UPI0036E77FA8